MLVTASIIYSSPVFGLFATVLVVGWKSEPAHRWILSYGMFTANYILPYEGWYVDVNVVTVFSLRHRASCILGQAFRYTPENAFYIFNQQIYFII